MSKELNKAPVEQAGGDERAAFEAWWQSAEVLKCKQDVAMEAWQARAALAQPSQAPTEGFTHFPELLESVQQMDAMLKANSAQAEAERPEVVARVVHSNPVVLGQCGPLNANDELMTVAQHAASVARWAEMFNRVEQERDAAQAEVERLRQFERICEGLPQDAIDGGWTVQPGTKLYAAPVAQAQQLHDLDKQCRDDVARALGLRPSQERGFAWSYLLASIKSCVKASEDAAQAQHSVPDELRAICMLVAETGIKYGRGRHRAVAADECRAVVNAVLDADLSVGRACEYAGCCDKAHPGTSLCIAHHSKKAQEKLLAAAPGKEGNDD
ncbi:hypothetical protein ACM7US_18160 [Pseudomonas aeruginosa]